VYSFYSFDILPLVEFQPEDDIPEEEALRLIEKDPLSTATWQENRSANVQSLSLNTAAMDTDLFGHYLDQYEVLTLTALFSSH
jgi:hypothetical protein